MLAASLMLAACGSSDEVEEPLPELDERAPVLAPGEFPASLAAFGKGYPQDGDPCRKLGESEVTLNWLSDSTVLVGCPSRESADALGGSIVETVDGFLLVTLAIKPASKGDTLVPGTGFHATGQVRCAVDDPEFVETCAAGVKRKWGPDGSTLVEVTKPDGSRRAIFFDGRTAYGAETAQADGSAAWTFAARRRDDTTIIEFGPERYAIPDALVFGG